MKVRTLTKGNLNKELQKMLEVLLRGDSIFLEGAFNKSFKDEVIEIAISWFYDDYLLTVRYKDIINGVERIRDEIDESIPKVKLEEELQKWLDIVSSYPYKRWRAIDYGKRIPV